MLKFNKSYQFILSIFAFIVLFLIALAILVISLVAENQKSITGINGLSNKIEINPVIAEVAESVPQKYFVSKIIDGDTIELEDGVRVRYIGINAPEMTTKCYAQEATDFNRQLVEGKSVTLEKDISETDKYDRLLRYVYLDGVMVNEKLVAEGFAQVATYPPDVKYASRFLAAQKQAKLDKLGLWSKCPVK